MSFLLMALRISLMEPLSVGERSESRSDESSFCCLEETRSNNPQLDLLVAHTRARIMQLRLELQSTKKGSMSMIDYIMKIKGAADNLAAIGEPVSEQDQVMNLLGGLGSDYNAVVTAINIRDDKISLEAIHSMLLAFEHRLEQQSSIEQMSANYASSSNNRGGGRKFNGGRGQGYSPNNNNYTYRGRGRGGRNGQGGRQNSSPSEKPQCQLCGKFGHTAQICYHRFDISFQGDESWYLDSGASHHLTQNLGNLTSTSPYTGTDRVTIGNGKHLSISNIGSKQLHSHTHSFRLKKDLHTKMVLAQGKLENGLYKFPVFSNLKPYSSINNASAFHSQFSSTVENKAELWHNRLGHASFDIVSKVMNTCNVASGKYKSLFVLIDQALPIFKRFKLQMENQFDTKIKCLQSDNGGEFRSFTSFLQAVGIAHRFSCPYNSAQNGRVERKHRHVVETGLALLSHASLPMKYWHYAFQTATFLINRMPSKVLETSITALAPRMTTRSMRGITKKKTILDLSAIKVSEPSTLKQAFKDPNWTKAMEMEIAALHRNHTWDLVEQPPNVNVIGLVKAATIRIILTVALSFKWEIRQLDVHNAFLNGMPIYATTNHSSLALSQTNTSVSKRNNARWALFSPSSNLTIEGFTDADWGAHLDDRRSSSGYLVYLGGNLVSWSSTKQKVVSRSSASLSIVVLFSLLLRLFGCKPYCKSYVCQYLLSYFGMIISVLTIWQRTLCFMLELNT
ncbi:Retrovirus-related Pol polyprotein from transposon RE1 [Vitis vinifera]|uniref:Retrovirus-related Pol polyprotein from transposon RE1 n=1 Tax=Vitis vinifera TaxID=29760 RepID=A0A438KNY4_VITVI|nr:Retrovirus-related Pol polyprotein from transposon RE1 [Vitis vinifera]